MSVDHFDLIDNYKVLTMSECIEEMQCSGNITRVPDHSVLQWEMLVDWMGGRG